MPKKKKNAHSPARGSWTSNEAGVNVKESFPTSDGTVARSESGNNSVGASARLPSNLSNQSILGKDEIIRNTQEMFSHLDPEVVYMVLVECDFKVDKAADSLLEMSEERDALPAAVSGFEIAAALLESNPPAGETMAANGDLASRQKDLVGIGTHLTADFDNLIDRELASISGLLPASSPPAPPDTLPHAPPELLQSSVQPGQVDRRHGPVYGSQVTSPLSALSFMGEKPQLEPQGVLDFSHLTSEPISSKPSLDIMEHGRPSAFQAYRKESEARVSTGNHLMSTGLDGTPLTGQEDGMSLVQHAQKFPETAVQSFWNMEAPEFMPRAEMPAFITPVAANPGVWGTQAPTRWIGCGFAAQAPLKPAATIPKSWAKPATPRPPFQLRANRLIGQLLVLMRGAPGSGKSTAARNILQDNPGGVILSTDDYFMHNGFYNFDLFLLDEAHEWNHRRAKEAFEKGVSPIIIDNTNLQCWEMKPYVALALQHNYKVLFREPDTWWKCKPKELERRSKHGVPKEKIRRMLERFDQHVSVTSIMGSSQKPLAPSGTASPSQQEISLSQPSLSDARPDLVEEPHAILGMGKAGVQLYSSMPDVSSVGGNSTKDESLASCSNRAPNANLSSTKLQTQCALDQELDRCSLVSNEGQMQDKEETLELRHKDQECERPVAFFESIGQRVRRGKRSTRHAKEDDDTALPELGNTSITGGGIPASDDDCTRPELLDFVGDWPMEVLEQREQRTRGENNRRMEQESSEPQKAEYPSGKVCRDVNSSVTEFQKLLDLLEVGVGSKDTNALDSLLSSPVGSGLYSTLEGSPVEASCVQEAWNRSTSSKEGESQMETESTPELLDCVEDWMGTEVTPVTTHPQKPVAVESTIISTCAEEKSNNLPVVSEADVPDRRTQLQNRPTEESHSSSENTCKKSESPEVVGLVESDGNQGVSPARGSQERKLRQNRRSSKQCRLALTFSNNSPTSPQFCPESPLSICFDTVSPAQPSTLTIAGTDCATQTNPQDFALLWRLDRQCQTDTIGLGVRVMRGDASRFLPQPAAAAEHSSIPEVPYRVLHDNSAQVEEQELNGSSNKLQNLQVLSRHFKLVSFDMLEDLYEKCHQDMEWTTNLLLDSGEKLFKDDDDGCAASGVVGLDPLSQVSVECCSTSVELPLSCPESKTTILSAEQSNDPSSSETQHQALPGSTGRMGTGSDREVDLTADVEKSEVQNSSSKLETSSGGEPQQTSEEFTKSVAPSDQLPIYGSSGETSVLPPKDGDMEGRIKDQANESQQPNDAEEAQTGAQHQGKEHIRMALFGPLSERSKWTEEEGQRDRQSMEGQGVSQAWLQKTSIDIQTLELKLPPELALQLSELFGPVGVDPGSLSPDDCVVQIDLNLARLLHQKWKETIQERQRQEALSYQLLQESSTHWGESALAASVQQDRAWDTQFLLQPDALEDLPFMDHWNAHQPHVSLRDIMMQEEALQQNMEKHRLNNVEQGRKDGATVLKENQLYTMFPAIDRHFLKDIFRDNNYSLDQTEQFLRSILDQGPVKTVVAPEPRQDRQLGAPERSPSRERGRKLKEPEPPLPEFQDVEDPEYMDFRAEATLQWRKQQECFTKAADAYRQGVKQVASFYSQQGHLHGQKMKEANHRAAMKIFERVNSSLLPENVLDLHGLHVDEALYHLEEVLESKTAEWQSGGCRSQLSVITGRGNHSQGGVARIRPAVIDYLNRHSYRFSEPKPGLVLVTLH